MRLLLSAGMEQSSRGVKLSLVVDSSKVKDQLQRVKQAGAQESGSHL